MLYGTTREFLERLGLPSLEALPSLGDFVPDASVVEALERGLRVSSDPTLDDQLGADEPAEVGRSSFLRLPTDAAVAELHEGERLQKVLARAGLGSRRVCEELIADGRVTVNGEVAQLGRRVEPDRDAVALDGVPVVVRDDLVYYLLNKPTGYVSTASDPEGRHTVVELVPESPRVFPVGRLDYDTEGLLLLTNDGDLTHLLTHPRFGVVKTYLAEVEGDPAPAAVRTLREGVELDDGVTAPARVNVVQSRGETQRGGARHPRGPEPPGATHVRGGRPPRGPAGARAHRPARATVRSSRGSGARSRRPKCARCTRPRRPPTQPTSDTCTERARRR